MSRLMQDLITSILLCLPVNALLRFRCLSKSFCLEIDSADFRKAHLDQSIRTKTRRRLIFLDQDYDFFAIDFDSGLNAPTKLCNPQEFKGFLNRFLCYRGSCNGLLLLSESVLFGAHALWLWNPFTRKINKLPHCPGNSSRDKLNERMFGFGYDPLSNDYKVVQINTYSRDPRYRIWVFSMRSNTWKKFQLPTPFDSKSVRLSGDAVSVDGALHWLSLDNINDSVEIISFDISKEKFVDLIPKVPFNQCLDYLEVLGGRLAYYRFQPIVRLSCTVKNGQQISWAELHDLFYSKEVYHHPLKIFEESKDGNKILLLTSDSKLSWYDLKQGTLERDNGLPVFMQLCCARVCWESLVSPTAGTDDSHQVKQN